MVAKKKAVKKAIKKAVKKSTRVASGVVHVGRFDGELTDVNVKSSETLEEAFKKAGINLDDYKDAEINTLNAQKVSAKTKVKPGVTYLLTGNYENGC